MSYPSTIAALLADTVAPAVTGTGPYSVYIAGNLTNIIAGSLRVDSAIGRRSQASFTAWSTDGTTHFQQYQQITIYDHAGTLIFSGYIDQPKEQKPGFSALMLHTIQAAIDQHFLADKRRVAASYTNKTCGFIAQDLVNTILVQEGVTIGQIYDGLTPEPTLYPSTTLYPGGNVGLIPQATFVYCKVSEALDALVQEASASGVPYYWQIDQNKQLWFVPYTAIVNSTLVDGTQIDQVYNPPFVTRANPTYRNTQYVLGGVAQTVQQTETRKGDGNTRAWTMGYALASAPTITVNGAAKTVGLKGTTGSAYYYAQGDQTISQDSGQAVLISTDTLQVVYIGQYPTVIADQNAAQISYEASFDGTSGIIEEVAQDTSITSIASGLSEASNLLTRYGIQGTILEFSTLVPGFNQGQLITVNLPAHSLYTVQMLIESMEASDNLDGFNIWYRVKAVLGPYDTTWVQFFSSLLASPAVANSINVGLSQSLQLLASGAVTLTPTMSGAATVFACPIPNTTLFPSTTLFPC